MEDSHIAIPELAMVGSKEIGMYAVFDGHGGAEVAKYCQKHLPNAIRAVPQWRLQEWKNALCASFHSIDRELQTIEAQRELKVLIGLDPAEADAEAATIQTRNAAAASSAGDPQTKNLQQMMVMKRMLRVEGCLLEVARRATIAYACCRTIPFTLDALLSYA